MSSQTSEDKVVEHQSAQTRDQQTRWRVNRQLLPLKMFYFFFYGASGSILPFVTVYLKYLRLNASEAGLIAGLAMFLAMLLRAFIGMLADKMNAKKAALLVCSLGFGTAFFSMWFVPRRVLSPELSANSTKPISQQNQHQFYAWICLTDDGQEICSYPPNIGSSSCQIFEEHYFVNTSEYQDSDGIPVASSEKYVTKYLEIQTDEEVKVTEASINGHHSGINDQDKEGIHLAKLVSNDHVDKIKPCFYVNSEAMKHGKIDVEHESLGKSFMTQMKRQVPTATKRSEDMNRQVKDIYHANPISSAVSSWTNDTVSCLLNCSRRLVNSFNDEESSNTLQPLNDSSTTTSGTHQTVILDLVFSLSFVLLITGKSMYSASTSLIDAVAYTILGPYSLKWGQQRLWGTVGTGVVVLTITLVNDSRQIESFAGTFIACFALSIMTFLIGLLKLRAHNAPKNKTFFKDIKTLVSKGSVRLFLCKLLFYGMMAGTAQNFIFWFLMDIGSGQITLGAILLLYCISSVILLRYSRRVLHKLGQTKVMYLTLVAYAIRYLELSFLTNAWQALPGEILNGVTYSLFWAAASSTASIVAPPGTQATSQGLAGAMYWDLGRGIGIVITGQLLQMFGARWTFKAYSVICIGILPVFWMLDRIWSLQKPETEKREDKKEQDGDVEAQLLESVAMNGSPLNNNVEKSNLLDKGPYKDMSATIDDTKSVNTSEKNIYFVQCTFAVEDVRHGDLETPVSNEVKDSVENIPVSDYNSKPRSTSNSSTTCHVRDRASHRDQTCPHEATNGTVALSISSEH